jgi:hypothetical protein
MSVFLSSSERRNMVQSQGFSGIIRFFEGYGSRKAGIVEGIQSWESGTSFATILSFNCSTFASSANAYFETYEKALEATTTWLL